MRRAPIPNKLFRLACALWLASCLGCAGGTPNTTGAGSPTDGGTADGTASGGGASAGAAGDAAVPDNRVCERTAALTLLLSTALPSPVPLTVAARAWDAAGLSVDGRFLPDASRSDDPGETVEVLLPTVLTATDAAGDLLALDADGDLVAATGAALLPWLLPALPPDGVSWSLDALITDASVGFDIGSYALFVEVLLPPGAREDEQQQVSLQGALPGPALLIDPGSERLPLELPSSVTR